MKKKITIMCLIALAAVFALAACANKSAPGGDNEGADAEALTSSGRKIIYTASFTIRCRDFDSCKSIVEKSLETDEWFDSVSYSDEYASYTARVKTERLDAYINGISNSVGADKINGFRKTATDVSLVYYSKQGQIDALEAEYARLITLMGDPATTISDLILINTRLSAVEYELQKVKGELNKFDSQLDYSTVYITVDKILYGWVVAVSIIGFLLIIVPGIAGLTIFLIRRKKNKTF